MRSFFSLIFNSLTHITQQAASLPIIYDDDDEHDVLRASRFNAFGVERHYLGERITRIKAD